MERQHSKPQAAVDGGPSPLWLFGGGAARHEAAAAGARAASRALPREIGEDVYARLDADGKKALRLVNSWARAYHDARVTAIRFEGAGVLPGLRQALERGAAARPPRFQRVEKVMFGADWGGNPMEPIAATTTEANTLAAALLGLRALPALRTLVLGDLECDAPQLVAAIAAGLPAHAPCLEAILWEVPCPPALRLAFFLAAARLPAVRSLQWMDRVGDCEDQGLTTKKDCAHMAAALRMPGAFQHLKTRWLVVNPPAVVVLASARLPALEDLVLAYEQDFDYADYLEYAEPLPSSAPGLQLITAAPWFKQLRRLDVREYDEPPGDVTGAAIPLHLTSLTWSPARRDDTGDTMAALSRVLMTAAALRELDLDIYYPGPPGQPSLPCAAFAALLAAPGSAGALEELTLSSGVRDGEVPPSAHPLAALAAARLSALRSLAIYETRSVCRDFMAELGAAPWAPQLIELHLSSHMGKSRRKLALLGDTCEARAAVEALAAAPLTSLRELDLGMWQLPLEAMIALVRAPWLGGLDRLRMYVEEDKRGALCAASPEYAALCDTW